MIKINIPRNKVSISLMMATAIILLQSCVKKEEVPENSAASSTIADNILNTNAGFDSVYNYTKNFVNFETGGLADMTLESNGNLNIAFYTSQPSQQQPLFSSIRVTKNINTNQMVPLPKDAAANLGLHPGVTYNGNEFQSFAKFRPYTNYFVKAEGYATSSAGNRKIGYNFSGDYVGSIPSAYDQTGTGGTPNMTFIFPSISNSVYGRGVFVLGIANPNYLFKVLSIYDYEHTYENGLRHVQLEPRYIAGETRVFELKKDSFKVYNYDIAKAERTLILSEKRSMKSLAYPTTLTTNYSLDGKIMGFLYFDETTKSYWSYSYNFTTNKLTQVLVDQKLDYIGTNSDLDLDEYGNVYYSGIAGNGSNTTGVSIYKKTSGGTSVVGSDNFLRTGEIIGLRYLLGKVYLAVFTGTGANAQKRQITILKEN